MTSRASVDVSADFKRIASLPRRVWNKQEAAELAELMTVDLKTLYGTEKLRPIQAIMCAEAADAGGLFAACGVGSGKTLPSFLIPSLLQAQRPLLLVQANLLE